MDEREELELTGLHQEQEMEIARLREEIARLTVERETICTKWLDSSVNSKGTSRDLRENIMDMEESSLHEMMDFYFYHYLEDVPVEFEEEKEVPFDEPVFLDWFLPEMLSPSVVMDVLSLVDEESFALFQRALTEKQEITYTPFQGLTVLVESGFLFLVEEEGTYFIFATEDVRKAVGEVDLKALAVKQKKNQELFQFTQSAVHLYGGISFEDLFQIQQDYNLNLAKSPESLETTLEKMVVNGEAFSLILRDYVSHGLFEEFPEDVLPLMEGQKGKPRYVPESVSQFLEEGTEDFFHSTPESGALMDYVESYQQDETALDNLMVMLELGCLHNDDMNSLYGYLEEFDALPVGKKAQSTLFDMLIEMEYHSRKWVHNGLSAFALDNYHGFSLGKKQTLQRFMVAEGPSKNGPCPCGSGKKYKRCCGK
ncbi:MAG: SEC-C metal-binding domain-containing protein [Eubacteriales bacterium]